MDIVDTKTRSRMMSRIRAKDTKPEMIARRYFWRQGLRYRLHVKELPGRPDIVFPKHRAIVEVRGCFWHGHQGCAKFRMPKSSRTFWRNKIIRNRQRDATNIARLRRLGWRVYVVWECQVSKGREGALARISTRIVAPRRMAIHRHG
jgi:DNA mismatch endonuclease (patch repair protein)